MTSAHRVLQPGVSAQVPSGLCALAIMTKAPRAGQVKTRLTPPLTPEESATLNIAFLQDMAEAITRACARGQAAGVGVYTPVGEEAAYENILPNDFYLIPQRGEAFGDRLVFALQDLWQAGFESVCLINSDSPTVPAASFAEAVEVLSRPDDRVVLGPSDDGGYYLIGLKKLHRRLFEAIAWSTERVLDQTKEHAAEIGLPVHSLPVGSDVDDKAALRRLCGALLRPGAERLAVARSTRAFLQEIVDREGRERIWPRGS